MKASLSLPLPLECEKMLHLCLLLKIYYERIKLIMPASYASARINHRHKVGIRACRTDHFLNSFILRTTASWKHLPWSLVEIADYTKFKAALTNLLLFQSYYFCTIAFLYIFNVLLAFLFCLPQYFHMYSLVHKHVLVLRVLFHFVSLLWSTLIFTLYYLKCSCRFILCAIYCQFSS